MSKYKALVRVINVCPTLNDSPCGHVFLFYIDRIGCHINLPSSAHDTMPSKSMHNVFQDNVDENQAPLPSGVQEKNLS